MGAHKMLGRPSHHLFVQVFGVEPHPVDQKGVANAGIIDPVSIFFPLAAADGIEVLWHLGCLGDHDISWQAGIDRQRNPVAGNGGSGAEIGHIPFCVDPSIGTAGTGAFHWMPHYVGQRLFQGFRHGDIPFLHLPAVVGGAVVHQRQSNVAHPNPSLTAQSSAAPLWPRTAAH